MLVVYSWLLEITVHLKWKGVFSLKTSYLALVYCFRKISRRSELLVTGKKFQMLNAFKGKTTIYHTWRPTGYWVHTTAHTLTHPRSGLHCLRAIASPSLLSLPLSSYQPSSPPASSLGPTPANLEWADYPAPYHISGGGGGGGGLKGKLSQRGGGKGERGREGGK